jgi:hypothetical protein
MRARHQTPKLSFFMNPRNTFTKPSIFCIINVSMMFKDLLLWYSPIGLNTKGDI